MSDSCGFGPLLPRKGLSPMHMIGYHNDPRCWYNVVKQQLDLDLTNVSYSGYSNEEILDKISNKLVLDDYELILIQLTSTQRKWFYRAEDPFDFLSNGDNVKDQKEKSMYDYFRVYFNNELVEIEHTLNTVILIQKYLDKLGIPLLLINGFGFGEIVTKLRTDPFDFCQSRMNKKAWSSKGQKYSGILHELALMINKDNFVAIDRNFVSLGIDRADDGMHPGEQSNLLYSNLVSEKIQQIIKK